MKYDRLKPFILWEEGGGNSETERVKNSGIKGFFNKNRVKARLQGEEKDLQTRTDIRTVYSERNTTITKTEWIKSKKVCNTDKGRHKN